MRVVKRGRLELMFLFSRVAIINNVLFQNPSYSPGSETDQIIKQTHAGFVRPLDQNVCKIYGISLYEKQAQL